MLILSRPDSRALLNTWKIVKPKPISDSEVRITDISVRSALMRVRWNDMPVRRIDISVRWVDNAVRCVDRSVRYSDSEVRCSESPVRCVDSFVRCCEYSTEARSGREVSTSGMGGGGVSGRRLGRCGTVSSLGSWRSGVDIGGTLAQARLCLRITHQRTSRLIGPRSRR